jgi:hypothetical protein
LKYSEACPRLESVQSRRTRYRLIEPVDQPQRELTARLILPYLEGIMAELAELRKALDGEIAVEARRRSCPRSEILEQAGLRDGGAYGGENLSKEMLRYWTGLQASLKDYPKGACMGVTHAIYNVITKYPAMFAESPLDRLRIFKEAGGVFKPLWGSIRNIYFQNAMQVGSHYIDVANDTVDIKKPSTDEAPMEDSGFKNFETFGEYARVRASYTGDRIYRNNFIPSLLPYRPLWLVNPTSRSVWIDEMSEPISWAIELGNGLAFADLSGTAVGGLTSAAMIDRLGEPFGKLTSPEKLEFRLVQDAEFQKSVEGFQRMTMTERFGELKRLTRIAKLVNIVWARAGMYDQIAGELPP